jgi:ribosomal-protein-alanine N-acetyltransferase
MSRLYFRPSGAEESLLEVAIPSERVLLVPTSRDHAEEIFRQFTAEVTRYMYPRPAERIEETLEFIAAGRANMEAGTELQLTILARETEAFLGCCGLHGKGQERMPELGIWLRKGAHGHGYGREAIAALVDWAFRFLDLDHILYPVDRRNAASRRIPESLGGVVVGEKRDQGMAGNPLDLVIYRLDPPGTATTRWAGSR